MNADGMGDYIVLLFYRSIAHVSVPIFVMVSGAVFLDPERDFNMKKIYTKYILRIVFAFAFWSLLYATYNSQILLACSKKNIIQFVVMFCRGNYHMWYLWMLIGLYIFIPILRPIANSPTASLYLIVICILFDSFPLLLNKIVDMKYMDIIYETNISGFISKYLVLKSNIFIGYFVAGNYLNKLKKNKIICNKLILMLGSIIGVSISILLNILFSVKNQKAVGESSGYTMPMQVLASCCIFMLMKNITIRRGLFGIRALSKCSFGIYLVHPFVISALINTEILDININLVLWVPIMSMLVLILSYLISYVLNRISLLNRYIV